MTTCAYLVACIKRSLCVGARVGALLASLAHPISLASAQSNPITEVSSECLGSGGLGDPCSLRGGECANNSIADLCVLDEGQGGESGRCYASCEGEGLLGNPSRCAFGEQCVASRSGYYCKPVPFQMDLNLLDQCISYWLEGGEPAWSSNRCSLEANLNRLLDQNLDYRFDIFDLDLCVLAFLDRPAPPEDLRCDADEDCGLGLYCDLDTMGCTRECGLIPSREVSVSDLDRECVGHLKTCDYERGRCVSVPVEVVQELTCQVDRECPSGAYCFLGQCAPHCYRGLDCPSSDWYCTDTNTCRVLPDPAGEGEAFVFDPSLYAIRFTRKRLDLDAVKTRDEVSLAIMDLITRQQVVSNPSVSFGYRLQLKYAIKDDLRCLAPFPEDCESAAQRDSAVDPTAAACYARRADCVIDPQTESWIRLTSPFGVVSAAAEPSMRVELEEEIADRLSPGTYRATLKVVYDNGDSDELLIYYNKKSPSGEYVGTYKVHYDQEEYSLSGTTPLNMSYKVFISDELTSWDQLLREEGVTPAIQDIATGQKVYAYLHGDDSVAFARPKLPTDLPSQARSNHDIPFLGVYYPDRALMRLIGRSVIPKDYLEREGSAAGVGGVGISVENLFGRDIERQVELFGPFSEATGLFYGLYSEQIKGMTPTDFTLRGSFVLKQRLADTSPPGGLPYHLLSLGGQAPSFPQPPQLIEELDDLIDTYCFDQQRAPFRDLTSLDAYLTNAQDQCDPTAPDARTCRTFIFPELVTFSDLIGEALGSLGGASEPEYLTIYDYLRARVQLCPEETACTRSADCADGYECNRERGRCVVRAQVGQLQVIGDQCGDQSGGCGSGQSCDDLNGVCLTRGAACTTSGDCASGELCQQTRDANAPRACVRDLTNYSCVTIIDQAYLNRLRDGEGALPSEVVALLSRAQLSYAEFKSLLPSSIDGRKTLCLNTSTPLEFQGYSAYSGGDEALCVSENNALCGLYLHQRALLTTSASGRPWVDTSAFSANIAGLFGANPNEEAGPTLPLFCDDAIEIAGCVGEVDLNADGQVSAVEKARLVLREHNRFWLHIAQALKFQGDAHLSDAFMTLYRNQDNPFTEGAAIVYKREQQAKALARFDQLLGLVMSSPMARLFFDWPIDAYLQRGNDWLKILQTLAADRMETLASIVDLDRRVFLDRTLTDKYDILQNTLQHEYLFQAYLLKLQIDWQSDPGFRVAYEGRSEQLFREGQAILNQVNTDRNPIGLFDQQVYFESARTRESERSNWEHYLDLLVGDDGQSGMLGEARADVEAAVTEMKDSLRDLDALEEKIFAARRDISGYMAEQCGPTAAELQATMSSAPIHDANADGRVDYCDYLLNKYSDDALVRDIRDCKLHSAGNQAAREACARLSQASGYTVSGGFTYSCDEPTPPLFVPLLGASPNNAPTGATLSVNAYGAAGSACDEVVTTFVNATNSILTTGGDVCAPSIRSNAQAPSICGALCPPGSQWSGQWSCDPSYNGACSATQPCVCGCVDAVGGLDPLTAPARCDLNRYEEYAVTLAGRKRMCVGGQMGALIQERRALMFQREQVVGSMETLLKRFTQAGGMGEELNRVCLEDSMGEICNSRRLKLFVAKQIFAGIQIIYESVRDILATTKQIVNAGGDAIECELIAGLAVGTDCPQGAVAAGFKIAGTTVNDTVNAVATAAFNVKNLIFEIASDVNDSASDQASVVHDIREMVREVDGLITEFQTLTVDIFNASLAIDDLRYQIGANYATYQDDVRFIVDHLVGRETGNLLRGRRLAIASDAQFRELLQYSYRMYMAFLHQYNISPANAAGLKSRLLNATTLDDVERFIKEIKDYARDYCGREGIDCDTLNNVETLRISLRERGDPALTRLRDIVDARTGRVVTAGEQFHNTITSPPFLQQATLNQMPAEVIEFNFPISLMMQDFGADGPEWLINPLDCNHLLVSGEDASAYHPGNIAVNIIGRNLGDGERSIRYELIRGGVDLLRSCHTEVTVEEAGLPPVSEYPVRPFTIGYAPQSNEAQLSQPRSFATRSGLMGSCVNTSELSGILDSSSCWRFFARGRSLSSHSWRLRIPVRLDDANTDNSWLLGRGLPRDQRPVIEDIIIYLRYHSRPTSED